MSKIVDLGKKVSHYKSIDSTQKEIWRRIENKKIENGEIVIADIQTDGIGTHGRKWYTTKQNNIAFSFAVTLDVNISKLATITREIAEVLVQILKETYNINIEIKEPNDMIINQKKAGGILTETKLQGENVKYLVIGIGINTNQEDFDDEIKNIATSIKKEFNLEIDNTKLIKEFCKRFQDNLNKRLGEK